MTPQPRIFFPGRASYVVLASLHDGTQGVHVRQCQQACRCAHQRCSRRACRGLEGRLPTMTVIAERSDSSRAIDPRTLVSAALFDRLVMRIVRDEGIERRVAERVMTQALGFLKACTDNPGVGLGPSEAVDAGWHAFILHTREYAAFCERVAGRFIHHRPNDDGRGASEVEAIGATVAAMRAAGVYVDPELWIPKS